MEVNKMAKGKKKRYTARERKAFWFGYAQAQDIDSFNKTLSAFSKEEEESYYKGFEMSSIKKKNPFLSTKKKGK